MTNFEYDELPVLLAPLEGLRMSSCAESFFRAGPRKAFAFESGSDMASASPLRVDDVATYGPEPVETIFILYIAILYIMYILYTTRAFLAICPICQETSLERTKQFPLL